MKSPRSTNVLSAEVWRRISAHAGWTERERQTAWLLVQDKKRPAIARHLEISLSTVRAHVDHVFEKLHVSDRGAFFLRIMELAFALRTAKKTGQKVKKRRTKRKS